MKIIGLTGGIASGKSTISRLIREKGIPVICADELARKVVEPGYPAYKKMIAEFGEKILNPDKTLNRPKLALLVFSSPEKLKKLNSLIHPAITQEMKEEIERLKKKKEKMVVLDIPLLFEEGLDELCDKAIVVYAPEETQRERLKKRENLSDQEITSRLKSQMLIEEKKKLGDFVIDNSGTPEETKAQLEGVLEKIKG